MPTTPKKKTCSACRQAKPRSEFYKNNQQADGLASYCKACHREKRRSWQRGAAPSAEKLEADALYAKGKKRCKDCGKAKPLTEFYAGSGRYKLHNWCKPCSNERTRDYYRAHPEKAKEASKRWRAKDPKHTAEVVRRIRLRNKYGLEPAEFDAMYEAQQGLCAICRKAKATDVDHCHTSGKVRGMLCGKCNKGLGHFCDDPAALIRAAEYLR